MANDVAADYRCNAELYSALMRGAGGEVIQTCGQLSDGPLHILTIHNDTVLHMATYSKQIETVIGLLRALQENHLDKMTRQNDSGNTILHEASTVERSVPAAKEMLLKAPKLLSMRNKHGETALFRAVAYGRTDIFDFLDDQINNISGGEGQEARNAFFKRNDKTSILHVAIHTEHFDLALLIAQKYEYLISERDGDGMNPLQLLACNRSAFKSGRKLGYLKELLHSCVSRQETRVTEEVASCYGVPFCKAIQKKNQKYESALKLAKFLMVKDTSWDHTGSAINWSMPKTHKYGRVSLASQGQGAEEGQKALTSHEDTMRTAETALFLATKLGIMEIVEEILKTYPQAVEHIDHHGRNILHIAIKYRQIHILNFLEKKMEIPMIKLIGKIDNYGNSILHTVALKPDNHKNEKMRSPALLLHEDVLLFERLKEMSTARFVNHVNNMGQTAEELFACNNDQLRTDAKEWLKRTAENCSIVAVLIATVAFAAAYTVPGGPNQITGYPLLIDQPFFVAFTMTDVLSLTLALTSVIVFLSVLTSPFRFKDFKHSLPQKLMLGVTLLIISVSMMMLAFAATVILMIHNKERWTRITLYSVAFLPVSIFALTYLPLYISLMKTLRYSLRKIDEAFPWCRSVYLRSRIANSLQFRSNSNQPQTTGSSCTPQNKRTLV